jgi:flavin reductase (DIM6/NTAB) family NADH-FMN oxidoreductase RutF
MRERRGRPIITAVHLDSRTLLLFNVPLDMADPVTSPIARALGRIPSGLFIVTSLRGRRPSGFLGSFVMQSGFEPPTVSVAVGRDRPQLADIRQSGRFALSILDSGSRGLMAPFLRRLPEGKSPLDGLAIRTTSSGSVVLAEALAWIDCLVTGEFETGDHAVVFGEVLEGALLREAEPCTHVRKNGLDY